MLGIGSLVDEAAAVLGHPQVVVRVPQREVVAELVVAAHTGDGHHVAHVPQIGTDRLRHAVAVAGRRGRAPQHVVLDPQVVADHRGIGLESAGRQHHPATRTDPAPPLDTLDLDAHDGAAIGDQLDCRCPETGLDAALVERTAQEVVEQRIAHPPGDGVHAGVAVAAVELEILRLRVVVRAQRDVGAEFLEPPRVLGGLRRPRRHDVVGHRERAAQRVQEGARPLGVAVDPPAAAGDSRVAARGGLVALLDDQNARSRVVCTERRGRTRRPRSDNDHVEFLIETRNAHVRPSRLM